MRGVVESATMWFGPLSNMNLPPRLNRQPRRPEQHGDRLRNLDHAALA